MSKKIKKGISKRQSPGYYERKKQKSDKSGKRGALIISVSALLVIIIAFIWMVSPHLVRLREADGYLTDKKHGITYINAPISYEPVIVSTAYARCGDMVLYRIKGLDPKEWLTEEYNGIGSIYYADTVRLPGLADFKASGIKVCEVDEYTVQKLEITDADFVNKVVKAMTEGESVALPSGGTDVYHFKFTSPAYPGIYYDIRYIECNDNNYLNDRGTGRTVAVGDLMYDYIDKTEEPGETDTDTVTSSVDTAEEASS